jgi:hypothetical protein
VPQKCIVQNQCHNKCDNDGRTKKYIEYVVELHPPPRNPCEFQNYGKQKGTIIEKKPIHDDLESCKFYPMCMCMDGAMVSS